MIPDPDEKTETVVGNLCGLCYQHHQDVTENSAWIQWDYAERRYVWLEKENGHWQQEGELDPHPLFPGEQTGTPMREQAGTPMREKFEQQVEQTADCPTCKRRLPQQGLTKLPARRRKTWVVKVPDDSEDGAAVLDILVEECAKIFQREDHHDFRYFTLVEAMALLLQHKELVTK
jgi:hypothetical protein